MKNNEEEPESLAGLGRMLPAEVLKEFRGSISINIYKSGSQHVDNIQTQHISLAPRSAEGHLQGKPPSPKGEGEMPDALRTASAMALWKKAQQAGYVDAGYQPLLSRSQSALLADAMAERLGIKAKWKTFETLWNRKYMRSDYNKALAQQQSLDFQDELKRVVGG